MNFGQLLDGITQYSTEQCLKISVAMNIYACLFCLQKARYVGTKASTTLAVPLYNTPCCFL